MSDSAPFLLKFSISSSSAAKDEPDCTLRPTLFNMGCYFLSPFLKKLSGEIQIWASQLKKPICLLLESFWVHHHTDGESVHPEEQILKSENTRVDCVFYTQLPSRTKEPETLKIPKPQLPRHVNVCFQVLWKNPKRLF